MDNSTRESISQLRSEVSSLKRELKDLKRAILGTPEIGDKVQRKLWEH